MNPESWWGSFDHVATGSRTRGAQQIRRAPPGRHTQPWKPKAAGPAAAGPAAAGPAAAGPAAAGPAAAGPAAAGPAAVANLHHLRNQEPDTEGNGDDIGSGNNSDTNNKSLPPPPGTLPPVPVESDNDEMAGTKINIPKFTEQETDVSDKAKDWFTVLQAHITEKGIGTGECERRCGLIRW